MITPEELRRKINMEKLRREAIENGICPNDGERMQKKAVEGLNCLGWVKYTCPKCLSTYELY